MPLNTRVGRCVTKLRDKYGYGKAIGICQHSTKQNYLTGKTMRRKKKKGGASSPKRLTHEDIVPSEQNELTFNPNTPLNRDFIVEGDRVRIISGPHESDSGTVISINNNEFPIEVYLDIWDGEELFRPNELEHDQGGGRKRKKNKKKRKTRRTHRKSRKRKTRRKRHKTRRRKRR